MELSNINWTIIIAVIASTGLVGVILLALQKQNFTMAAELLEKANSNPALKDAIEAAGKNVDPNVVNLIIGLLNQSEPLAASNADVVRMIEELKKLIVAVTDGLPNQATTKTGDG